MATVEATQRKKVGVQNNLIVGLNHISIFVRNVDEATKFWMDIFEAEPYRDFPPKQLFHVKLSGVVLAFFDSRGKLVDPTFEYPHYAFTASPEGMRVMKKRLDDAGVKTHPLWTRNREEALLYFRDPSGNLFELYCPKYDRVAELRIGLGKVGGDFQPPIGDLMYDWPKR